MQTNQLTDSQFVGNSTPRLDKLQSGQFTEMCTENMAVNWNQVCDFFTLQSAACQVCECSNASVCVSVNRLVTHRPLWFTGSSEYDEVYSH